MAERILADDLTGALDSACAFATPATPMTVIWNADGPLPERAAIDAATREGGAAAAAARHRGLSGWLAGGEPAFKKIDSLMRGHWAAETAALARPGMRVVVAPAFPYQGRVTRDGRQWRRDPDEAVSGDIRAALAAAGVAAAAIRVHDAETDADLDRAVAEEAAARRAEPDPVLWVGTGGLAAALARARDPRRGTASALDGGPELAGAAIPLATLPRPILALVGTHHPVTIEQIAAARAATAEAVTTLDGGGRAGPLPGAPDPSAATRVARRLAEGRDCVVTIAFSGARDAAARAIADRFAELLATVPMPGTLFAAGGETLRSVCDALGATGLAVAGALEPGLPVARLLGGDRAGLVVVSKSGAFGRPDLLARLIGGG